MIVYRPRAVAFLLLRTTCDEWIIKIRQINGKIIINHHYTKR